MKTMHIRIFFLIATLMAGILSGCTPHSAFYLRASENLKKAGIDDDWQ